MRFTGNDRQRITLSSTTEIRLGEPTRCHQTSLSASASSPALAPAEDHARIQLAAARVAARPNPHQVDTSAHGRNQWQVEFPGPSDLPLLRRGPVSR